MKNISVLIMIFCIFLNGCLFKNKLKKANTGHLGVEVLLNGTSGIFLLDTGSSPSIVNSDFATKNGFSIVKYSPNDNISNYKNFGFLDGSFTLVVDKNSFVPNHINSIDLSGWGVDGVLGMDFLKSEGFEINSKTKTLILSPEKAAGEAIPLRIGEDNLPYVTISVNGCQFEMMLDTGANATYFNEVDWERVVACNGNPSYMVRLSNTDFSGNKVAISTELSEVPLVIGSQKAVTITAIKLKKNLLGLDYLNNFQITYLKNTNIVYFKKLN